MEQGLTAVELARKFGKTYGVVRLELLKHFGVYVKRGSAPLPKLISDQYIQIVEQQRVEERT